MERIENKIEKRNDKKNLKKKVLMVAGLALLLGFVGYTGGTTYARYVSSADVDSQTATVAKWGYTVSASSDNLFGKEYKYDSTNSVSKTNASGEVTVKTNGSSNVLAPGAEGSFDIHVNGTAEVLSSLTVTANSTDIFVDDYHPIAWTVSGTAKIGDQEFDYSKWELASDTDDLLSTKELTDGLNTIKSAKIDPNTTIDIDLVFTWNWAFDRNDAQDTKLGQLANSGTLPGQTTPYDTSKYSTTFAIDVNINLVQLAKNPT